MSLPNWVSKRRRRAFSALGNAAKARLREERGVDAETLRMQTLDDRRGRWVRAIYGDRSLIVVMHSRDGRTDQFDVIAEGNLFKTCGPRRLPAWLR